MLLVSEAIADLIRIQQLLEAILGLGAVVLIAALVVPQPSLSLARSGVSCVCSEFCFLPDLKVAVEVERELLSAPQFGQRHPAITVQIQRFEMTRDPRNALRFLTIQAPVTILVSPTKMLLKALTTRSITRRTKIINQ